MRPRPGYGSSSERRNHIGKGKTLCGQRDYWGTGDYQERGRHDRARRPVNDDFLSGPELKLRGIPEIFSEDPLKSPPGGEAGFTPSSQQVDQEGFSPGGVIPNERCFH
jgi:hypothetical protein